MSEILIILVAVLPVLLSFILTFYLIKKWIPIAHKREFVGKDMNKYDHPEVAEIGGLYSIIAIIFSLLLYIALKTYLIGSIENLVEIFAVLTILSLSTLIGLFDDILGWKEGLKQTTRVLITAILSLPLLVLGIGENYVINIPLIGAIKLGLLYPLIIIPIGIMGASNAVNMLAGYNGLEASLLLILFSGILIKSYLLNLFYISYISLLVISSLIAFLYFNKYPAKVFPGNSFTYGLGALYGALIILGNMEVFGIISFILYFIELILFIRGLLNGVYKENFGIPDENNYLKKPYDKIYSLTHFAVELSNKLFKKATEKKVVYILIFLQIVVEIFAFLI